MRVVAGKFGGRTLRAPRGTETRPTADRVREALFSVLGPLDDDSVLDLFAGSGALGIEALSRGAVSACFVDSSKGAIVALRKNLAALELTEATVSVFCSDALSYLHKATLADCRYDLVFIDPPYRLASKLEEELSRLLPSILSRRARVVCESSRRQPLTLTMRLVDERRYGDTSIRIYTNHNE